MNHCEKTLEHFRHQMVREQLLGRDISDKKVIDVFKNIPRHRFIETSDNKKAYGDFPLEIGSGQTISQPYMVALMVQLIEAEKTDRVLEIGTGSGYQTAILAELAKEIFSVECVDVLAEKAKGILSELGYGNIRIKVGDGTLGWQEFAPFDKIIVTASSPDIPGPLIDQLAAGGKLVIPVGPRVSQRLILVEKSEKGCITKSDKTGCVFVPLIGKYGWSESDLNK
ncbi:MAG: protein-L-isoaspartate(D-aspartate) O-methyltransferase [Candidatus Omnitrophica bacterium]|nr:protein-L-isoaspartate(D-aspartate) O-methyltransferase [Candidatus Omnitrophota bacterium]